MGANKRYVCTQPQGSTRGRIRVFDFSEFANERNSRSAHFLALDFFAVRFCEAALLVKGLDSPFRTELTVRRVFEGAQVFLMYSRMSIFGSASLMRVAGTAFPFPAFHAPIQTARSVCTPSANTWIVRSPNCAHKSASPLL